MVDGRRPFCYTENMEKDWAPFEERPHTADVGLLARGRSREELFANAARGMLEFMGGRPQDSAEVEWRALEVEGLDLEHLLVRWLSEVLGLFRQGWMVSEIEWSWFTERSLYAVCRVARWPAGFAPRREIKMVTHHGLKIESRSGLWTAEVVFDV